MSEPTDDQPPAAEEPVKRKEGGQPGNKNACKQRRWGDAIDRALQRRCKSDGIKELDRLADKFLDELAVGGINGFKEFGDRMDGKSTQAITGADGEALSLVVNINRLTPAP